MRSCREWMRSVRMWMRSSWTGWNLAEYGWDLTECRWDLAKRGWDLAETDEIQICRFDTQMIFAYLSTCYALTSQRTAFLLLKLHHAARWYFCLSFYLLIILCLDHTKNNISLQSFDTRTKSGQNNSQISQIGKPSKSRNEIFPSCTFGPGSSNFLSLFTWKFKSFFVCFQHSRLTKFHGWQLQYLIETEECIPDRK